MGFNLNQLVEGQVKDPQVIVNGVNNLLDKSGVPGAGRIVGAAAEPGSTQSARLCRTSQAGSRSRRT